jgi:hypothetical protein
MSCCGMRATMTNIFAARSQMAHWLSILDASDLWHPRLPSSHEHPSLPLVCLDGNKYLVRRPMPKGLLDSPVAFLCKPRYRVGRRHDASLRLCRFLAIRPLLRAIDVDQPGEVQEDVHGCVHNCRNHGVCASDLVHSSCWGWWCLARRP